MGAKSSSQAAISGAAVRASTPRGRSPTTGRVVVSSFFADIFRNNALNNGLLPITVSGEFLAAVFAAIDGDPATQFTVDLDNQTLTICATGRSERFEIDAYKKRCLQNGYDDVDYLRSIAPQIEAFEQAHK